MGHSPIARFGSTPLSRALTGEELPAEEPARVNDPELQVEMTRTLGIIGEVPPLQIIPAVLPVINLGDVVARVVEVRQPAYRSSDVFSAGLQTAAPINTIHADTGQLAAGTFDIKLYIDTASSGLAIQFEVQHRNAADTADLAVWAVVAKTLDGGTFNQDLGYEFELNERLRILNLRAIGAGAISAAVIFARLRA